MKPSLYRVASGHSDVPDPVAEAADAPAVACAAIREKGSADAYAEIDDTPGRGKPRGILEDETGIVPVDLGGMGSRAETGGAGRGDGEIEGPPGRAGESQTPELTPPPRVDVSGADDAAFAQGALSPAADRASLAAMNDMRAARAEAGDFDAPDGAGGAVSAAALLDDIAAAGCPQVVPAPERRR